MRILLFALYVLYVVPTISQVNINHRWKKLKANIDEQYWYDISITDPLVGNKFDVWILQVHTPPLHSEGINGEVFRSKTLYTVDLNSLRYGILKLYYYDNKNSKLYRFDYDNPPPITDKSRYPYPILEETPIYFVIKTLFNKNDLNN